MKNFIKAALLCCMLIVISKIAEAQSWNITGNAGTDPALNFIGTTDNKSVKIRTNNAVRMTIGATGKVGIGTTSPVYKLDIKSGSINTDSLYRIGGNVALSSIGFGNTMVGITLNSTNTGTQNTFLGSYAGYVNSSGANNTFLGYSAGYTNTTGTDNTCVGQGAGSGSTGSYNTSLGKAAGYFVTGASGNTYLGYAAGYGTSTGSGNTFTGYRAGQGNLTGRANVYVGGYAGYTNATGMYIVAVGDSALYSNVATANTAVGSKAGYSNTTAAQNAFFGASAGKNHVTGSGNCYFGNEAGLYDSTGTYNTCIGANSGWSLNAATSNTLIGNFSGYVTSGDNNTFVGKGSGAYNTTGGNNTFIGFGSGGTNATTLTNAAAIGYNAAVSASNAMVLGNTSVKVGIGLSAPNVKLHVVGGTDASLGSGGYLQLGATAGANTIFDENEIMARNNGAAALLYLNYEGGDISLNGGTTASQVMIGTLLPATGYMLSVNGKVIATEMRVELKANWPDYVFASDYKLMDIKEFENSILANKHLPGMPSAAEMKQKGGIDLGDMQTKMLEKIEELSLYIIQMQKKIDRLEAQQK